MTVLSNIVIGLLLLGVVPFVDLGYAKASEVTAASAAAVASAKQQFAVTQQQIAVTQQQVASTQDQLLVLRVGDLDTKILDTKERQCHAASPDSKATWTRKLVGLKIEYETLTHRAYPVPGCDEL